MIGEVFTSCAKCNQLIGIVIVALKGLNKESKHQANYKSYLINYKLLEYSR